MHALRDFAGVADIERSMQGQGVWLTQAELQERVDNVSIALFGITEADTRRVPIDAKTAMGSDPFYNHDKHGPLVDASERDCAAWEKQFELVNAIAASPDGFLAIGDIQITDDVGNPLACIGAFIRQLFALNQGLVPGAVLTPDGSGRRSSVDAERWGTSLEREAKAFQTRRRR